MRKRLLSFCLVLTLTAGSLTGCSGLREKFVSENDAEEVMIRVNETLNSDTKWINSEIEGAIDVTTSTNPRDDFYTYVNKDWILDTKLDEDTPVVRKIIGTSDDVMKTRMLSILKGEKDPDAQGNAPVPEDIYEHDTQLVEQFATAAGDWDAKENVIENSLKRYIDNINRITTVEQMQDYICDEDGQNLFALDLANISVTSMFKDATNYYVLVDNSCELSLGSSSEYNGGTYSTIVNLLTTVAKQRRTYGYILERTGCSKKEILSILANCYRFESGLVDHMGDTLYYCDDWYQSDISLETTTRAEIESIEGNYPLSRLLDIYGYDTDRLIVKNPDYIKYLGKTMNQANLQTIKDYMIVHTVINSIPLLDSDTINAIEEKDGDEEKTDDGLPKFNEDDRDDLFIQLVNHYLPGTLSTVYVAQYCTEEEKEDLSQLTDDFFEAVREMISSEDWLSDDTKAAAIEKLDAMTRNVLYPDEFKDHFYLDFGEDTELFDMVADINMQSRGADAYLLTKPVDRSRWDLDTMDTTVINCFNMLNNNSMNILAGYIAGETYDIDMPIEKKMAYIGTVIGHEITHGFDTNGYLFDKNGTLHSWISTTDVANFSMKTTKLKDYYKSITPYPGAKNLNGTTVSGEAIADLGGMKAALLIAEDIEGFDYDLFFTSYEELWANKLTYDIELEVVTDTHPIMYLRGNIVPAQFDEFALTYGIKEGDSMYVAPDDRITVW